MTPHHDQRHANQSCSGIARQPAPRRVRLLAVAVGAVLTMSLAAACSDDDEASPEEAFCAAGDSLESNIAGLSDIDVVNEGTDAVDEQFAAIQSDLDELRDSGSDVAAGEIDALESAVDQLGDDLDALGDDISPDAASAVGASVSGVASAAQAVVDTLATTCP